MQAVANLSPLGVPAIAVALFLALSVGWLLLAARRTRRAEGDARTAAWFGFWRAYRLCVEGGWVLWLVVAVALSFGERLAAALPPALRGLATLAAMFGPPLVVGFAGYIVARAVLARLHAVEVSAREAALEAAGRLLGRAAPVLCLIAAIWSLFDRQAAGSPALWILAAFLAPIAGAALLRRTALVAQALAEGELRDRAFELARRGGVPLAQLYVLPARRTRLANAFAHFHGVVMVTDHLVERLGRREVDAVLAHELGHLRHRHLRVRVQLLVPVILGVTVLSVILSVPLAVLTGGLEVDGVVAWGSGLVIGICVLAVLAFFYLLSRRAERVADAASADITQDPEAMISALGTLSRLGLMPTTWSAVTETFTTHPATLRRAQALAVRFGLPFERMRELLENGLGEEVHYSIPRAAVAESRLYTTAWKQATSLRVGMATVFAGTGVLVAVGIGVARANLPLGPTLIVYAVAFALAALLTLELHNLLAAWGYEPLRRKLAAALPAAEAAAVARGEGWFVGFGPASAPRYYDGHASWDVGHLVLAGDAFVYRGDGITFALPRTRIVGARLGIGPPGWIAVPNLYVDWLDGDGRTRTFFMRAHARTLRGVRQETERLLRVLDAWHRRGGQAAAPSHSGAVAAAGTADTPEPTAATSHDAEAAAVAPQPSWREVTGTPPQAAVTGSGLLAGVVFVGVLAWAGLDLFAAMDELIPVVILAAARFVFPLWPVMRYREAKPEVLA